MCQKGCTWFLSLTFYVCSPNLNKTLKNYLHHVVGLLVDTVRHTAAADGAETNVTY